MEKYQPVRFLQLIVESMSMVLGKKKVARLQEYQESKHKELIETVTRDDGAPMHIKNKTADQFIKFVEKGDIAGASKSPTRRSDQESPVRLRHQSSGE
jgi:hypothetical protein